MDEDQSPLTALVGTVLTGLFLWVGLAMWNNAPSPADEAVGKLLVTLAGATAFVTVALVIANWERANSNAVGSSRTRQRDSDA